MGKDENDLDLERTSEGAIERFEFTSLHTVRKHPEVIGSLGHWDFNEMIRLAKLGLHADRYREALEKIALTDFPVDVQELIHELKLSTKIANEALKEKK